MSTSPVSASSGSCWMRQSNCLFSRVARRALKVIKAQDSSELFAKEEPLRTFSGTAVLRGAMLEVQRISRLKSALDRERGASFGVKPFLLDLDTIRARLKTLDTQPAV